MKKRILIIDDEEDFLLIAKLNLESGGKYEVATASDATNIIGLVRDFKPDVMLCDMLMPKIKGTEVCRQLRNDPEGSKIPVIMLTALDKESEREEAMKAGITDYLIKPIEVEQVIAKIEEVLGA